MISDHSDPLAKIGTKEAGGQNVYVLNLCHFLARLGVKVDIYTRWDKPSKTGIVEINKNFRVIRVKAGPKKYISRDSFLNVIEEFTANVVKIIKDEDLKYDIIHSNYWFSGIIGLKLARTLNIPQLHVYHSIGQNRFNTLKEFIHQQQDYVFYETRIAWEKQIAHRVSGIIATSPIEQNEICQFFDVKKGKIKCIPVGVDIEVFKPGSQAKSRKSLKLPERSPILLYVGRIEWRKGIETLLKADAQLPTRWKDAQLYIIGGGQNSQEKKLDEKEINRLKSLSVELGINTRIKFLGSKKQHEIVPYYVAADVCIVPSYYEPFGIVPLEAMACGTPVIASRTGGLQYTVVDNVTGKLVKPADDKALSKKIDEVLSQGKEFYSKAARQRVTDNFIWSKIAEETILYMKEKINMKATGK